ncbi:MAG: amino acid permease, partial [Acidithiobacillus sp.]|nr:amino acid permease [Acidithiobacillus sp.]
MESTPGISISAANLNKHLTIPHAVALVVGMVVGAGYLVIPGIVYHTAGKAALSAWILNGVVIIPLLMIFARIGASHPSADGLSGYFGIAFGRHAKHAMQILVLITFILAMPAIAIVGGEYASYVMHLDKNAIFYVAALFFISAGFVNMQGIV